jgi:segregation and condensation protein B
MEDLKNIIDSLLFVAEEPLSIERLKKILPQVDGQTISEAAAALKADYDARPGGFYLAEVAGGYQFRSRPEYTSYIRRMVDPKPLRLSKAAMETLAVIAYKQPIIRADVEHIRGVDCGGVLRVLLERKLVRVLGRKEIAGRPLIYATTKTFLETFDLKDLRDLPSPKEIEEFGKPPLEMRAGITIEPDEGEAHAPAEDAGAPSQADGYEESAPQEAVPAETGVEAPEAAPEVPATDESGAGEAFAPAEDAGAPGQTEGYEESAPQEPLPAERAVEAPEGTPEVPATDESAEGKAPVEKTLDFDPGTT